MAGSRWQETWAVCSQRD